MTSATVVEIGAGSVAECSSRILYALRCKSLETLKRELARASRVCRRKRSDESLIEEEAELLEAIVGSIDLSITGYRPRIEAEISLLGHLARA